MRLTERLPMVLAVCCCVLLAGCPDDEPYDYEQALADVKSDRAESRQKGAMWFCLHSDEYTPEAGKALIAALENPEERGWVAAALAAGNEKRAAALLMKLMESGDRDPNVAAAVGKLGGEEEAERLLLLLRLHPSDETVIMTLGDIGDPLALDTLLQMARALDAEREGLLYYDLLVAIGKVSHGDAEAVDFLLEQSPLPVDALGHTKSSKVIPRLKKLIEDPHYNVRIGADIALARIGTPEAMQILLARMTVLAERHRAAYEKPAAQRPKDRTVMWEGPEASIELASAAQGLPATQRAAAAVWLMEELAKYGDIDLAAWLDLTRDDDLLWAYLEAIGMLAGQEEVLDGQNQGHTYYWDSPTLTAFYKKHIELAFRWWEENEETVRKLAEEHKKMPNAREVEVPGL